jgi:hypothetical protein
MFQDSLGRVVVPLPINDLRYVCRFPTLLWSGFHELIQTSVEWERKWDIGIVVLVSGSIGSWEQSSIDQNDEWHLPLNIKQV